MKNCFKLLEDTDTSNSEDNITNEFKSIDDIKSYIGNYISDKYNTIEEMKMHEKNINIIITEKDDIIDLINSKWEISKNESLEYISEILELKKIAENYTLVCKSEEQYNLAIQENKSINEKSQLMINEQIEIITHLEEEKKDTDERYLNSESELNAELNASIARIQSLTNSQEKYTETIANLENVNSNLEESVNKYTIRLEEDEHSITSMKQSLEEMNTKYIISEKEVNKFQEKLNISELKLTETLKELNIIDASNITEDIIKEKDDMINTLKMYSVHNIDICNAIKDILEETNHNKNIEDDQLVVYLKTYINNLDSNISNVATTLNETQSHLNDVTNQISLKENLLSSANQTIEELNNDCTLLNKKLSEHQLIEQVLHYYD